ncbi:MAG: PEP-CTERM sorting domain-containing protein [Blastocatellia bacterium]
MRSRLQSSGLAREKRSWGFVRGRRLAVHLLILCAVARGALADTITYQQLRQDPARVTATAAAPDVARTVDGKQDPAAGGRPVAQESPNHPEFVRLPDGRIVRYGQGILCDENCVEPVTPAAFREPGPRWLWIIPPIVAGGILCVILCRPGRDTEPQPTPTIIIPPPSPVVSPTVAATISPGPTAPPPNGEIPEPGTLVLVGIGLGTMLARKRMKGRKPPK